MRNEEIKEYGKAHKTNGKTNSRKSTNNKKSGRGKGKGSQSTGKDPRDRRSDSNDRSDNIPKSTGDHNDSSWYCRYMDIANVNTHVNFNTMLGVKDKCDGMNKNSFPGICVLNAVPAVGTNGDKSRFYDSTAPVNEIAVKMYNYIAHKLNRRKNDYDPADLMQYMIALDSAVSYFEWCKRVYRLVNSTAVMNKYVGDPLIYALGVDAQDIRDNSTQFLDDIIQFGQKMSTLVFPLGMTYTDRHSWMMRTVFADSALNKCQFYMYNFTHFYQYYPNVALSSASDTAIGGALVLEPIAEEPAGEGYSYQQLREYMQRFMNNLLTNGDFIAMTIDISSAFEKFYTWEGVGQYEAQVVALEPEVLSQMHNTKFYGTPIIGTITGSDTGYDVINNDLTAGMVLHSQNAMGLSAYYELQDLNIDSSAGTSLMMTDDSLSFYKTEVPLDSYESSPSTENILVITRNMNLVSPEFDSTGKQWTGKYLVDMCGSEVFTYFTISQFEDKGTYWRAIVSTWSTNYIMVKRMTSGSNVVYYYTTADIEDYNTLLYQLTKFGCCPHIQLTLIDRSTVNVTAYDPDKTYMIGDITNFTTMSRDNLRRIHEVCLLSEFAMDEAHLDEVDLKK